MAQHTPGPWSFDGGWADGEFDIIAREASQRIAGTFPEDYEDADEAQANAHLLASAPDLLAALEAIVAAMPSDEGLGGYAPREAFIMHAKKARAAIAKAKGAV